MAFLKAHKYPISSSNDKNKIIYEEAVVRPTHTHTHRHQHLQTFNALLWLFVKLYLSWQHQLSVNSKWILQYASVVTAKTIQKNPTIVDLVKYVLNPGV